MIICCPHCQTKYQVTYDAIGSAGRKVQCAHCQREWNQRALPRDADTGDAASDALFEEMKEDALDEALAAEERAIADKKAEAPKAKSQADAAEQRKRQQAFTRRQSAMISSLPLARLRRTARVGAVMILIAMATGAYLWRVPIVERYPELADVYEAVGLGVNVVGLDFTNLETLRSVNDGQDVLMVSAQIVGLTPEPSRVPPVVVSLLDGRGKSIYEWSVTSRARDLMKGERATFETRLTVPPKDAAKVRLSFAGGSNVQPDRAGGVEQVGEDAIMAAPQAEPAVPEHPAPDHSAPAEQHH